MRSIIPDMVSFEDAAVRDWDFPRAVAGVALLIEHAREHGLTDAVALAGSGLTTEDLASATEVTAAQELRVVRNLRARLGEVGPDVGRRYRASTFGVLGYALLASRTVHEAMNIALRFLDLSHTFAIPRAELDGERVRIVVDGTGLPGDVRRFLVERDAAAISRVLAELAGMSIRATRDGDVRVLSFDAQRPRATAVALRPGRPGGVRGSVPRRRRAASAALGLRRPGAGAGDPTAAGGGADGLRGRSARRQ